MKSATNSLVEMHTKSHIEYMPIIDLNPNSDTCIYSILHFVLQESQKTNQTACITFDQPLWLKAMRIIKAENLPIVCRLGGFHTLMSYLGSIGYIMKGSGLEELFEEVYAPNVIQHIMSGKAVKRAIRAHTLAQSALTILLLEDIANHFSINFLQDWYNKALAKELTEEDIRSVIFSQEYATLYEKLQIAHQSCSERSRTSQLFLSYIGDVENMKMFITADRTSNWELHLDTLAKMLNMFSATGHIKYAKCTRV